MERMPKQLLELEVRFLGSEALVFDPMNNAAHRLSELETLIFSRCDGVTLQAEVAQELEGGHEALRQSMATLRKAGLVAPEVLPEKSKHLIVSAFPGEVVIFHKQTRQVHHLNQTAAIVFSACDGKTPVTEVIQELASTDAEAAEELVWSSLRQFREKRLLSDVAPLPGASTRREFLSMGAKAALLPVVVSVLAPVPAQALSCRFMAGPCTAVAECCNNGTGNNGIPAGVTLLDADLRCEPTSTSGGANVCCIRQQRQCNNAYGENPCCTPNNELCCAAACANAGTCRRPVGQACTLDTQCCSGSCPAGVCVAVGACV